MPMNKAISKSSSQLPLQCSKDIFALTMTNFMHFVDDFCLVSVVGARERRFR